MGVFNTNSRPKGLKEKGGKEYQDLITKAKAGDDDAFNALYERSRYLIHSNVVRRKLNFDFRQDFDINTRNEIDSTLSLIFVEAVKTYDESRGSFSTYLINYIKWRFRQYTLKEKMIPINSFHKDSKYMKKLIEETYCFLHPNTDYSEEIKNGAATLVSFEVSGETFKLPTSVFFKTVVFEGLEKSVKENNLKIYKDFIDLSLKDADDVITVLADKYSYSRSNIIIIIRKCNRILKKTLNLKDFRIEYGDSQAGPKELHPVASENQLSA